MFISSFSFFVVVVIQSKIHSLLINSFFDVSLCDFIYGRAWLALCIIFNRWLTRLNGSPASRMKFEMEWRRHRTIKPALGCWPFSTCEAIDARKLRVWIKRLPVIQDVEVLVTSLTEPHQNFVGLFAERCHCCVFSCVSKISNNLLWVPLILFSYRFIKAIPR